MLWLLLVTASCQEDPSCDCAEQAGGGDPPGATESGHGPRLPGHQALRPGHESRPQDTATPVSDCPVYADWEAVGGDGTRDLPYGSVAEAMARLLPGCLEIRLLPGVFLETVDYGGVDYDIRSLDGPDVTAIEAPSGGSVVSWTRGETGAAVLAGVTLRGGTGTPGTGVLDPGLAYGGGLLVIDADPTIQDCVLRDNTVLGYGGGGYLHGHGGSFRGNRVEDNLATKDPGEPGGGGGLRLTDCTGTIEGNHFLRNESRGDSADGGAMEVSGGSPLVTGNTFDDNLAEETGGGVRSLDSGMVLSNNLFLGNAPDGLHLSYDDHGPVVHNTFVGNTPYGITTRTCCGYEGPGPTSPIANNLVVDSGEIGIAVTGDVAFGLFASNDVYGAGTALYSGLPDPSGTNGNISVDPGFVAPDDLRLAAGSVAVDAGVDASAWGVVMDIDGAARPLGRGWDLGAYESW